MKHPVFTAVALLGSSLFLFACGGDGSAMMTGPTPAVGTVSGSVVLGPVSGASVRAYAVTGGTMGAQLGSGTTDSAGNFTISIGHHAGPLMLQASGGSYSDEATGTVMTMQPGDELACAIPSVAADATTTGVQVTPLTSMAQALGQHMSGGMTAANAAAANAGVGNYFMVSDILMTMPMDPSVAGSGAGATQDMRDYGMAIAAMSQYAKNQGMAGSSSGMVTAMVQDASDGVMNGMMGSAPIPMGGMSGGGMMGGGGAMMQADAGTAGLAAALSDFTSSTMNRSGVPLSGMQALIGKLTSSSGTIP
jgi:hypothetical protein